MFHSLQLHLIVCEFLMVSYKTHDIEDVVDEAHRLSSPYNNRHVSLQRQQILLSVFKTLNVSLVLYATLDLVVWQSAGVSRDTFV